MNSLFKFTGLGAALLLASVSSASACGSGRIEVKSGGMERCVTLAQFAQLSPVEQATADRHDLAEARGRSGDDDGAGHDAGDDHRTHSASHDAGDDKGGDGGNRGGSNSSSSNSSSNSSSGGGGGGHSGSGGGGSSGSSGGGHSGSDD